MNRTASGKSFDTKLGINPKSVLKSFEVPSGTLLCRLTHLLQGRVRRSQCGGEATQSWGFLPQPQRGPRAPNPHSLGGVGAGESPMSDCRRRALLGFCKVRVSRHKGASVVDSSPGIKKEASCGVKPPHPSGKPLRIYKLFAKSKIQNC